ncbi:putative quinol monooxygenase [Shewanella colwelliana]|uniref:putative quinol monooxygenase n=1 Tax=Shewanella colwelliana TaxID=23 RepID=UPI0022AE88C7|nr:antibiotic biosynthesis monooxygenase [Shewanella colwelliana]MCZ4338370.1 antibiotic biosynthesis monooxygenase [Shewanella colwelliana]
MHQLLLSLAPYITASKGCLAYEVLRQQDNNDLFAVIERWQSIEEHRLMVSL